MDGAPIQPPNPAAPPRSGQITRNATDGSGTKQVERPTQGVNRPVADRDSVASQYARVRAGLRG